MPPVISFIGWHNSGKTTLTRQVVALLKARGYVVAVIKSTKERGIAFDSPQTDTALYKAAGADGVALLAPDQLAVQGKPPQLALRPLARRLFPEADIVVAEGFKRALDVPKIEVRRDSQAPLLRDQVTGVVATATDLPCSEGLCFGLDQAREITDYIETSVLVPAETDGDRWTLTVDGAALPLDASLQRRLDDLLAASLPADLRGNVALRLERSIQPASSARSATTKE
jgi:molybdopterin-guanine dinucleotide biosynthesis protein B